MLLTSIMRTYLTSSFKPFEFKNTYTKTIDFENEKGLGLYVHIPFCRYLCSFCPYCKVIYKADLAKKYKYALIREIEMVGACQNHKKEVTSLYFGGGTPALMAEDLDDIIKCLKKYFVITGNIGIELHPSDICEDTLKQLKSAGVTMVSVGIQSFNKQCLSALGRENINFVEKLRLVHDKGFDVIDVDLIFAIPNQTEEIIINDIETAFSNGATQISTYPFIDFTFTDNTYKPLPEKGKKKMLNAISEYCKNTGRCRTSVWTFAKANTDKYSSITRDNFLGFGVSAATLLKEQFKINTFSIEGYIDRISQNKLPTSLTLSFSIRQRMAYYLFWSAYSMEINEQEFEDFFGASLSKLFGFELWVCRKLGFTIKDKNKYYLTKKGGYYYHFIEQTYTLAYIDKMWNVLRETAFPHKIVLK